MKEVPKKDQEDVGGGTVYQPWCPPPQEPGYPQLPGCPTDPPSVPGYVDPPANPAII
jgi:hypothetical protein